jgi:hypothetical protein
MQNHVTAGRFRATADDLVHIQPVQTDSAIRWRNAWPVSLRFLYVGVCWMMLLNVEGSVVNCTMSHFLSSWMA